MGRLDSTLMAQVIKVTYKEASTKSSTIEENENSSEMETKSMPASCVSIGSTSTDDEETYVDKEARLSWEVGKKLNLTTLREEYVVQKIATLRRSNRRRGPKELH